MLIYIYYFIIATLPAFYVKQRHKFIYTLFILNVVAIVFRNYYDQGVYIFTLRSVIYLLFLLSVIKIRQWKNHPLIVFYFIYLALLLPLSNSLIPSIVGIMDTVIIWGSFVFAYEYFTTKHSLKQLISVVIVINTIFIVYVLFLSTGIIELYNTQIDLGYGLIKTGTFSTSQINVVVIAVAITPFLLYLKPQFIVKRALISTSFISAAIILLNLKRTSLAALIICIGIFYLIAKRFRGVANYIFLGTIMLMLIFAFFGDILQYQIASRYYIFEASHYITGESRLKEFDIVLQVFKDRPLVNVLFGENLFDTGYIWLNIFGYRRILHNDWTSLLASTGVVGLGIFTYLYLSILLRVIRSRPSNHDLLLHRSISLGLMISSIIWILFGGFYLFVASSTLIMFVVGSYLGQIDAHNKRKISSA
jgi:hypothetical protein